MSNPPSIGAGVPSSAGDLQTIGGAPPGTGIRPRSVCVAPRSKAGVTITARFGRDGITICDPNRAHEVAAAVFQRIYDRAV